MTRTPHLLLLVIPPLIGCQAGDADTGTTIDVGDGTWDESGLPYAVVDTNQVRCFDVDATVVDCAGTGQDGEYAGNAPTYTDHGVGTVTDEITGLRWEQGMTEKLQYGEAAAYCEALDLGGRSDWRLPTTKELYSLMDFSGETEALPYIDDGVFDFAWGDESAGERLIDAQWATATLYESTVMGGEACFFGVNHADGRIKCYPTRDQAAPSWRVRCVTGRDGDTTPAYGVNDLVDNSDQTITDQATGLTWTRQDSGGMGAGDLGDGTVDWPDALALCEALELAGHDDWRLPSAKELHSIVDYGRSPDTTASAALDPLFEATPVVNEAGQDDFGFYWSSTTHLDGRIPGTDAVYVAFGRAIGQVDGETVDVHGAGAQRGDPKIGDRADYPSLGNGPQGDARRVFNLVRCVR